MNSRKVDLARHRLPSSGHLAELVLENLADFAVFTICLEGTITSWNSAAERVMGWSEEEAVGQDACMIFTPEDRAEDACERERATARRCGRAEDERWHLCRDGSRFWGSGALTRLEDDETGEHIGYVKIVRDRTEQHLAGERLRVSEARLRGALGISTVGVLFWGEGFRLTEANDAFLRMTGFSHEEAIGKTWRELTPPEFYPSSLKAVEEVTTLGEAVPYEKQYYRKDGSCWWGLFAPRRIGDEVVEFVLDITDRRKAEAALRAGEARFRALVAATASAVWTTDAQGLVQEDSPSWRALTGQTLEQWLGTGWADAVHPDDRARAAKEWATAVATGTPFDTEFRLRRADGEWRLVAARGVPVREPDGTVREWVGTNTDITARRRAEEARRAIEERYHLAVRATNDAIWDWDLRRDRIEWNEALQEAFGHRLDGAVSPGGWWLARIHPEDRERVSRSIHAVIDGTGDRWSDEYRFQRADGSYADVLDRGFMVRGPGGEPLRMIGAMLDVTERRQSERELRRLNEHLEVEVARRAEQLRLQEEALRQSQKLEAVGQLTGGVAHDFNNLLTVIRSSAGLLRRPNLPEERRRRYVEAIADTADRAAKLTGQLLAFARRQPLKPEVFAVGDRVKAVVELVRPLVGARISIEAAFECEDCTVEADPNQFETALVNLAVNARDAMDGEGQLTLRTWLATEVPPTRGHAGTPGAFVAVAVSDTGSGIAPELLARIFEPFFTTKDSGKGTGLGLSQVYGFAKQSGGELHVGSELGRGSTFTLYLPRAEAKPLAAPTQPAEEVDAPLDGRRNVLLVEDNTQVGDFARQMLEDLGYAATWAPNAKAALELLDEDASRFDVVFSDVVMPGMNGVELGKEIRRRWPDLPIVLTSGYSHVLANGGAQGFELLHKPYSAESVSRVLRSSR
ncbi:PAS domain S-box protein [Belnapia sp. T18]|uniref:histidine kinase n=1 Tax=Belnapia arida TaxID=2804533 RepID=A0ABS1U9M5_9PROT|nr:PAS domain S-box protein [Belnapia arida]MBL6080815.1 PAS domain S-box protein [Belnapia arida]